MFFDNKVFFRRLTFMNMRITTLLFSLGLFTASVQAGVIVGGTRIVYNGSAREVSLSVKNADKSPYLIQAWADDNGADGKVKSANKPPFVATPPLFRLDEGTENLIRIIRTGGDFPQDRESVYWMNIKSIPSVARNNDKNVLQISVKTRIKLFYRPDGIQSPTEDDFNKVSFKRSQGKVEVINPTPYYISFYTLKVGGVLLDTTNVMVPPKASATYNYAGGKSSSDKVAWQFINDYGGNSKVIWSQLR